MSRTEPRRQAAYLLLPVLVAGMALAGYAGYVLYPRFDLSAGAGIGLLSLAVAAGVASFFSPCSFPLLVTTLSRSVQNEQTERRGTSRILVYAASLAAGATAFLLLFGIGLAAGGSAIFREVTFESTAGRLIRLAVGSGLIALGLVQLNVLRFRGFGAVEDAVWPLREAQARLRRRAPWAGYGLLGFSYVFAGFG